MDRRRFLQTLAVTTAAIKADAVSSVSKRSKPSRPEQLAPTALSSLEVEGHTLICQFRHGGANWKVYEDLRTRDGAITFINSEGRGRVLSKNAEATFSEAGTPYLGLDLKEIRLSSADLLADQLLRSGDDPDPKQVRDAAPPLESDPNDPYSGHPQAPGPPYMGRLPWNTFVGTKECLDTMPIDRDGTTRNYYFPAQDFPEVTPEMAPRRLEGLVGGWLPIVRKIMPISKGVYVEALIFGDVDAHDEFIVQTWHRTARVENGKIVKVVYGYSYPAYPPTKPGPAPESFYQGLLKCAAYWDRETQDVCNIALPEPSYVHLARHAFVRELIVRPRGVYPKYGAVDRDYYGPETDGFQDTLTSSVYANLELGRFEMAKAVLDNYFTQFVDSQGTINMRGPETAQFGLTLSLLARYFNYTRDSELLAKHRGKIEATAAILTRLHDVSLQLPPDNSGYGLIQGWAESDASLFPTPEVWWKPYFSNSAFAARGFRDISLTWSELGRKSLLSGTTGINDYARDWMKRSEQLRKATIAGVEKSVRKDMTPPYVGLFPDAKLTFRESLETEHPSPQQWPHRVYAELLQADILPPDLANLVIDCMRAYGATTLGVLGNVDPSPLISRDILGFIAYGYAQMLLRLDRIEEFVLFLYSHRFHDHTPGSWTAGEVAGIIGRAAIFCIPAQLTTPVLVRWMLVLEDSDSDRLYFGKGLPRSWVGSGKEIKIDLAPTRWGRVSFAMKTKPESNNVTAHIALSQPAGPKELSLKMRLPLRNELQSVTVNGQNANLEGPRGDTIVIKPQGGQQFEIVGKYS
jgi:hypothetical protein